MFGYFDSANQRVIVTYLGVPAIGTTQPNTLQIAIYESGKIEMIIGELAATGTNFAPGILGTIGSSIRDRARLAATSKPQTRAAALDLRYERSKCARIGVAVIGRRLLSTNTDASSGNTGRLN